MKKILKYLWIIPILLLGSFAWLIGQTKPNTNNMELFNDFSKAYVELIQSQPELENPEGIKINLNDDLIYEDNTYKIRGDVFSRITGSKISYNSENEIEISYLNNNVVLYDNSNAIRINSNDIDIMQSESNITYSSITFPIETVAKSLGYTISINNNIMTLNRPYQTKRLIVESNSKLNYMSAINVVEGYDNLHILQYETEDDTIKAYNYYSELKEVSLVEVDKVVTPASYEEDYINSQNISSALSYTSWGAEAMGINNYSEFLINEIGENNFPELIVAVLDTGLDSDHIWFSNRIADDGANFSSSSSNTDKVYEDVHGHGTHVSGIIVDLTFSNVKILPIKVMNNNGYGYSSAIRLGIDYVNNLKDSGKNIIAMNLSLGTTSTVGSNDHSLYRTKLETAYNKGIISVVAAGNDGVDCSSNTPANVECVITVSAVSHTGDIYYRPTWSNFGEYVDVCAPGGSIRSAAVGGGLKTLDGTSMAAPHIASAIALFYTNKNKNYSISDIEELLDNTAVDLGDNGWDKYYGEGLVNIKYANANLIDDVQFSNTTQDHSEPFLLELSTTTPNASIYYTTNGDTPTLTNGILYSSPIQINKTQKISAIAYVIDNDEIVSYSKVRTIAYCFYGEDIQDAYEVTSDGTLVSYSGTMTTLTIPMSVNGVTITKIGENAFMENSNLISVTLPSSIKTIGRKAFYLCYNLRYIYAPSVTSIGIEAFMYCQSLTQITDEFFPKLEEIDKYAFALCYNINTISLTNTKIIDFYSFYMHEIGNSVLTTITLPSVTTIGENAFFNCNALQDLNLPNVKIISSNAFNHCNIENLYLPELQYLGSKSFYSNSNLITVDLPKTLVIGSQCFYNYCTKITTVSIPQTQIVGSYAFAGCKAITSIDLSELHDASSNAFNGLEYLEEISLPKLQYAGKNSFYKLSNIKELNLPNIIKISAYAFGNSRMLSNVTLPSSLEYIDDRAFQDVSNICNFNIYYGTIAENFVKTNNYLNQDISTTNNDFKFISNNNEVWITGYNGNYPETLVIPSYINSLPVTRIVSNAFINCNNIYNLNISKLKVIEEYAFVGCNNLTSITLNSIEQIEREAFKNCINLDEINISNVSSIGDKAFYGCPSLLSIKLSTNITSIGDKALGYIQITEDGELVDKTISSFVIYGYNNTIAKIYANNNDLKFNSTYRSLGTYYYDYYDNNGTKEIVITLVDSYTTGSLIIPSELNGFTISKIAQEAFMNCSFITGIQLPSTIKTIESYAFYECILLESINLENITKLDEYAFYGCVNLKNVDLSNLTTIPKNCFTNCEQLTEVNIPKTTQINANAFENCYDLTSVYSPNVEYIEKYAFNYCTSLKYIDTSKVKGLGTIDSATSYTGQVFTYCEKLTSAYLPKLIYAAPTIYSTTLNKVVVGNDVITLYGKPFSKPTKIYGYENSKIIDYAKAYSLTYEIIDSFSITNNLSSTITCYRFDAINLTINTKGFEESFEWYSTSDTIENGKLIEGEKSNTLTINTDNIGTTKYYAVIKNWDNETLVSNICSVTVFNSDSTYVISVDSSGNGTTTNTGKNYISKGDNLSIKFNVNSGSYIESIIIDNVPLSQADIQRIIANNYTYTFGNVSADHSIVVNYSNQSYKVTVIQTDNGIISSAKSSYEHGTNAYFTFTPNKGYYVEYLIIDGENYTENTNDYTFSNISDNHTISAKFAPYTNIKYTVNHFQQSLNNSGQFVDNKFYNLISYQTLTGTTGTLTNAKANIYTGFYNLKFDNTQILGDGSTIINIYYDRETITVNLFKGLGIDAISGSGEYMFGEEVTISVTLLPNYKFVKWTSANETIYQSSTEDSYTFTLTTEDADFTATAIYSPTVDEEDENSGNNNENNNNDNNNNSNNNNTSSSNNTAKSPNFTLWLIVGAIAVGLILIIVIIVKKSNNRRF